MPITIVTYAQVLEDDINASIPQLTDAQNNRVQKMREYFLHRPPAIIVFPGEYVTPAGEQVKKDLQAEYLCKLLHVDFQGTNRWGAPHLFDTPFHIHGFRYELNRLDRRLDPGQLGLVICSPKAASQACGMSVGAFQLVEIKSIPDDRLVSTGKTVRIPPPSSALDDATRELTPEERDAAMRQVEALMVAQQSINTGRRVADIAPSGVDMREILPELDELVAQGQQKKEGERTNPAWLILWILFSLCMAGLLFILVRTYLK